MGDDILVSILSSQEIQYLVCDRSKTHRRIMKQKGDDLIRTALFAADSSMYLLGQASLGDKVGILRWRGGWLSFPWGLI